MPYEAPSVARRGYLFRRLTHLLGCQLLELVIGEHRKQRSDRMDGQLAHPAYASPPRILSAPACPSGVAFILESRDPGEDIPFGSDQVFEALPGASGPLARHSPISRSPQLCSDWKYSALDLPMPYLANALSNSRHRRS
jgi:hypothetical protein